MNSTATIHELRETDLPAVRPLIAELMGALQDPSAFDLDRAMENCRTLLGRSDHHLMVARSQGIPCGLVHVTTRQTILHSRPSGLIDELVVSQEFRGQGVGRLLIDAAVDRCRDLGCSEVEVSTETSNRQAQDFYRRCGFSDEGVLFELHFPHSTDLYDAN